MRLVNGQLDVLLSGMLAVIATTSHFVRGSFWEALPDLLACLAAALTVWWPRAAGVALGAVLCGLLITPPEWASLGEYAVLIPILGTGMRGQRRARSWMTAGYGVILAALTWQDLDGDAWAAVALVIWAALIAVLWLIGNLFTAYRRAQQEANVAALHEHRLALARDLHDTVARELTRASLRAQAALEAHPSGELESVVAGIQQASARLRWIVALLRESDPVLPTDTLHGTLAEALDGAVQTLRSRGFAVAITIDGRLDAVPPALAPTLRAVFGEICANIERHADPGKPCTIVVSIDNKAIDAVFLNEVREGNAGPGNPGMGLAGVRERLTAVGGELNTEQEGSQWICRVTIAE